MGGASSRDRASVSLRYTQNFVTWSLDTPHVWVHRLRHPQHVTPDTKAPHMSRDLSQSDRLLRPAEAAARLGISVRQLQRLTRRHAIEAITIGSRTRRYAESAILDFIARGGVPNE